MRVAAVVRRRDLVRFSFGVVRALAKGIAPRIARGLMSDETGRRPSTFGLIGNAVAQASDLFSAEVNLAKTEIAEKLTSAVAAVASILGAGIFLIAAMIFLLQALVLWLVEAGWRGSVASVLVGIGVMAVALIAAAVARRRLTLGGLTPSRSIAQASKAFETVRGGKS